MTLGSAAALVALQAAAAGHAQVPSPQRDSALAHRDGLAPPTVTAVRADRAPVLDGILDEPVWAAASPATGFRRDRPGDGLPATERTEVRVAYTDDALYVGARMHDRDPARVSRLRGRRDSFMQSNDQFLVQIDSYHDHRTAFVFGVTPAGGRNDLVAPNDGLRGMDSGWDPVWEAATRVDSLGWTAEMRIPFSQLRFPRGERQVWGINFRRDILHAGEAVDWSWSPATEPGWASKFGHLLGLEGIPQPGRVEVLPYAVSWGIFDQRADPASPFDDGSKLGATMGLDLKYGLTSGLTLDATVNPDFGQVEADPAVLNLTVFETFFEERRPFFVEGSGLFGFGGLEGLRFFYSRRVGQRPALRGGGGRYVDRPANSTILGAAKVSGRTESGWVVAFMSAATQREVALSADAPNGPVRETPVDPLTSTTALRLRRDMRDGDSYVGAIATFVARDLDHPSFSILRGGAAAGGIDFLHRFAGRTYAVQGWLGGSRASGDPNAILRAQLSSVRYFQRPDQNYVQLDPQRTSLAGYAGEVSFRKEAGEWLYGVEGSVISPGFEMNDAGFQTVADLYALAASGSRRWVEPGRFFRSANLGLSASERRNFGNSVFNRDISLGGGGQTNGFRRLRGSIRYGFRVQDHRATRGGPSIVSPANWGGRLDWNGDGRNRVTGGVSLRYSADEEGSYSLGFSPSLRGRGEGWFSWSVGPGLSWSRSEAFYVTQAADPAAAATYGRRYVFAELEQASISVTARMNMAITPSVTFQVYAQPFVAFGDYDGYRALRAPGTFDFLRYGEQESTISVADDRYSADADGPGPAEAVGFRNPDFRLRSLRGNAVLRWEYMPGSTLFFVWSQDRFARTLDRGLDGTGFRELWSDPMRNVFVMKASFWLDF